MKKDFDKWNHIKQEVENKEIKNIFHEREIWWMSIGVNIGHEQDGKNESFERPVLVIRKFNSDSFIGVPLSTAIKENNPFYFDFIYKGEKISVILSQIRLFSAKRLLRYMYKVPRGGFIKIQDELRKVLKL